MLLGDLQKKDVVNVVDGSKLGKISDIDLDAVTGKILAIFVHPTTRIMNLFGSSNQVSIPWNKIVKIGGEVIIVNHNSFNI